MRKHLVVLLGLGLVFAVAVSAQAAKPPDDDIELPNPLMVVDGIYYCNPSAKGNTAYSDDPYDCNSTEKDKMFLLHIIPLQQQLVLLHYPFLLYSPHPL